MHINQHYEYMKNVYDLRLRGEVLQFFTDFNFLGLSEQARGAGGGQGVPRERQQ
jgi:hypothetical protein